MIRIICCMKLIEMFTCKLNHTKAVWCGFMFLVYEIKTGTIIHSYIRQHSLPLQVLNHCLLLGNAAAPRHQSTGGASLWSTPANDIVISFGPIAILNITKDDIDPL